ncbi:MAG: alpha/beta hydrolase [Roseococcus sp.]
MRESGLAYGPLPRQRMDLYRPADLAEAAPLLVFIHGGGWRDGAREQYAFLAQPMARLGLMVAIPDYRLWPGARFPAFVEDAALAVRMLAARERRRRLVLMGHSAGAFNAACLALDPSWGVQEAVGGFIGLAGPYDFRADEVNPPDIFPQPRIQAAPAPLRAVTTPPLLLLHGEADTTVGPYHSRILAERATTAGVRVRHVAYPGMSHLGIIAAMASPALWLGLADARVRDEVSAFLLSSADGGVAPR